MEVEGCEHGRGRERRCGWGGSGRVAALLRKRGVKGGRECPWLSASPACGRRARRRCSPATARPLPPAATASRARRAAARASSTRRRKSDDTARFLVGETQLVFGLGKQRNEAGGRYDRGGGQIVLTVVLPRCIPRFHSDAGRCLPPPQTRAQLGVASGGWGDVLALDEGGARICSLQKRRSF